MPEAKRSPYLAAIAEDNTLPIDRAAVQLWLKDVENPGRWILRPLVQLVFGTLLHLTWFLKRLPLPQFSAHRSLQRLICWFCRHVVTPEANLLILRHFATESNLLNFLADNSPGGRATPVELYPRRIEDLHQHSFVLHDQELFRLFQELGPWQRQDQPRPPADLRWDHWRPLRMDDLEVKRRRTQVLDFESAHVLFMCLFCLLLTREEYRDAINGFNLDQSIAIRIGQLIGDPTLAETAYNKYPLYLVGPWNLTHRFLMHGFFTEFVHARLEELRQAGTKPSKR